MTRLKKGIRNQESLPHRKLLNRTRLSLLIYELNLLSQEAAHRPFTFSLYVFSHSLQFLDTRPTVNNNTSVKLNPEPFPCSGALILYLELFGYCHDPLIFSHSFCLIWPCRRSCSIWAAWKISNLNFMPKLFTQYLFQKTNTVFYTRDGWSLSLISLGRGVQKLHSLRLIFAVVLVY